MKEMLKDIKLGFDGMSKKEVIEEVAGLIAFPIVLFMFPVFTILFS